MITARKFVCDYCQKICKSKEGLTRHKKVHKQNQATKDTTEDVDKIITQDIVFNLFKEVKERAAENKCYAEEIKKELKNHETEDSCRLTALDLLNAFKVPYKRPTKNDDVGQFYTYCYTNIIVSSDTYLSTYSQYAGTLRLLKPIDRLMALLKTEINPSENIEYLTENLSDKEKHGLKYIGGYILHKL